MLSRRSPRFLSVLIPAVALCGVLSSEAHGARWMADSSLPRVVSGGISDEGEARINEISSNYDLKLVFTGVGGIYLADVDVDILDRRGNLVLDTHSRGPMLLANLDRGRYTVRARIGGHERTSPVTIRENGLKTITMNFPITEEDMANYSHGDGVVSHPYNRNVVVYQEYNGDHHPTKEIRPDGKPVDYYDNDYHFQWHRNIF